MAAAIDPNALSRFLYNTAAHPLATITALIIQAAPYAPIGVLMALTEGRSRRAAILTGIICLDVSVAQQILRCLKPGHTPSLIAPALGILGALTAWYATTRRMPGRPRKIRILPTAAIHVLAAATLTVALPIYGILTLGMTPNQLATFLILHSASRFQATATFLESLDRMNLRPGLPLPTWTGANQDVPRPHGRLRPVASLRTALEDAQPGDIIELAPGHYTIDQTLQLRQPGPITLRAPSLGAVTIESTTTEAFKLYAPNWTFQNLLITGTCPDDTTCDHAFHIVGAARNADFQNLRLEDFNAHFKINGEAGNIPDHGHIEHVTLLNTHPRRTAVPVTPIDLDTASDWHIEDTLIADFAKSGGDQVSYGAYAKAAGSNNIFERNVILCEWHPQDQPGQRIGLSFGGGGSDPDIRRDRGQSGYEQSSSIMQDNLIIACSDDGIYINRSPDSLIRRNTLIGTAGIDVRFPESIATVTENLVDGPIRTRDDGLIFQDNSRSTSIWQLYLGRHPLRPDDTDLTAK
jgi:hypothetical protein